MIPESLRDFGKILTSGAISVAAPGIAAGALVEVLKEQKVDVEKATFWVQNNSNLWDILGPYQVSLRKLTQRAGKIDWMTADWAIDAMRKDLPAVASLFLGWRKAGNWLTRQVEIIKTNANV